MSQSIFMDEKKAEMGDQPKYAMTDMTIECKECEETFVCTVNEQMWFDDRDLDLPKRCHKCRTKRKTEGVMYIHDATSCHSSSSGSRPSPAVVITTITCSNCKKIEEVPFSPYSNRPVFCKNCYRSTLVQCKACGVKCRVPFVPKDNKPAYCRGCYIYHKANKK